MAIASPAAGASSVLPGVPQGRVYTVLGTLVPATGFRPGALATDVPLDYVGPILERRDGDVLVAEDSLEQIVRVDRRGRTSVFAGRDRARTGPEGAPAKDFSLAGVFGLEELPDRRVIFSSEADTVRAIRPDGTMWTVAGQRWRSGFSGDGGPATKARLRSPTGLSATADGAFLVADTGNDRVRRVSRRGIISTVAGNGLDDHTGDGGPATRAAIHAPIAVAALPGGGFLVAEGNNDSDQDGRPDTSLDRHAAVRRVAPDGTISTVLELPAVSLVPTRDSGFLAAVNRAGMWELDLKNGEGLVHVDRHGSSRTVAGHFTYDPAFAQIENGAPPLQTDARASDIAPARDGGLYFSAFDRVRYWAPRPTRRLAIGIAAPTLASPLRLRVTFRLTRRARVVATVRADRRRVIRRAGGTFRAGVHVLRIGPRVAPGSYDVTLTATARRATPESTSDVVRVRPGGILTVEAARLALGRTRDGMSGCRRMTRRRVDCPVGRGRWCQDRGVSALLHRDGTVWRRSYPSSGCRILRNPVWNPATPLVP